MITNRRRILQGAAALWGATTLGRSVTAKAETVKGERKFLFCFAGGGGDAPPLDPKFGDDG